MPGVKAILTADDLPDLHGAERALTNEPLYQGEPILARRRRRRSGRPPKRSSASTLDLEPLPFVVDPVESLRPGSAERATRRQRLGHAAAGGRAGRGAASRRGRRSRR